MSKISAVGTSSQLNYYSITDMNLSNIDYYYRLTQVDNNGNQYKYPVSLSNCKINSNIQTYPNPSKESFVIEFNSPQYSTEGKILIVNDRGKVFYNQSHLFDKGNHEYEINNLNAPPGIYLIQMFDGDFIIGYMKHSIQ